MAVSGLAQDTKRGQNRGGARVEEGELRKRGTNVRQTRQDAAQKRTTTGSPRIGQSRRQGAEGGVLQKKLNRIEVLIKEHAKGYENEEPHERQIRKIVSELMKKARTQ